MQLIEGIVHEEKERILIFDERVIMIYKSFEYG